MSETFYYLYSPGHIGITLGRGCVFLGTIKTGSCGRGQAVGLIMIVGGRTAHLNRSTSNSHEHGRHLGSSHMKRFCWFGSVRIRILCLGQVIADKLDYGGSVFQTSEWKDDLQFGPDTLRALVVSTPCSLGPSCLGLLCCLLWDYLPYPLLCLANSCLSLKTCLKCNLSEVLYSHAHVPVPHTPVKLIILSSVKYNSIVWSI